MYIHTVFFCDFCTTHTVAFPENDSKSLKNDVKISSKKKLKGGISGGY